MYNIINVKKELKLEPIIQRIHAEIVGRFVMPNTEAETLGEIVNQSGDGNYLDIGSLFGGSAILAALTKKEKNLGGKVICLDPLDGFYMGTKYHNERDISSGKLVNEETLQKNIDHFGVSDIVEVVAKKSYPLPDEIKAMKFSCVFIDGHHWKNFPTLDWHSAKELSTNFVIFHDCDQKHPSVQKAVALAKATPGWSHQETNVSLVVFKRA